MVSDEEKRLRIKFMMAKMSGNTSKIDFKIEATLQEFVTFLEEDTLKRIAYVVKDELERRKIPWQQRSNR